MFQLPSPLQKIENEWTKKFDIQLYIKRDDLIHAAVSGNKWRKLKYNLTQAKYEFVFNTKVLDFYQGKNITLE